MKHSLISCIAAVFSIGISSSHLEGQTNGTVSFTATIQDLGNGGEHWMVVWVTDATTGAYVRTLRKQCSEPRGGHLQSHMGAWYTAAGLTGSSTHFAPADGYTTATAMTYAAPDSPFTTTWNCKDALGNTVPDGTYKMWIQYAEDGLGSPVTTATGTTMTWTKGPTGSTTNLPDQGTNFTGMKVVWTPAGAVSAPEIAVEQPAGNDIADAGSKDFGTVTVGSSAALTFTIKNTGNADLTGLTITKDGTHAADFNVTSSPVAPVAGPSGTTTFIVSFAPSATGARTATIHITNNDSDENPFDITLTGTGSAVAAPEIAVEQPAGTDIADAGSKDFGTVTIGSSAPLTFTIKNTGNANLTGLTITKDGTNAADFTVTSSPTAPVAGPSGTTTFIVSFSPSAAGARTAAIHIANNDSNENPFDINLTGTGSTVPAPEIAVEQPAGTDIPDAGSKDFGSVNVGSNTPLTFTIKNTGNADLTGLTITKDGTNAADFTVTSSPTAPVAGPNGTTSFIVSFAPSAAGSRTATIHIANNDSDENPFNITLTGTGTTPAPEIAVEQPLGTDIPDGGSKNFGSVTVGSSTSLTFTIKNTGNANLTGLSITQDGANPNDFSVTSSPVAPVAGPSGATTFIVSFTPSAEGTRSAAIHIANNDSDENPFDITLTGTGSSAVTDPFAICFVGTLFEPRVGNQITLDLKRLTSPGQTVKVVGRLPSGLTFNTVTGLISGTLTGRPGVYKVKVQILQDRTVLRTIEMPITVLPFPASLIGDYDSLLEDAEGIPSGAFKISITDVNRWSATLENTGGSKRSVRGTFTLGRGVPTAPITAIFPAASGAQAVTVTLAIDGTWPNIAGTYNGGTLRGFRLAKATEAPPATVLYNLVFDAGVRDGIHVPAGLGWMKGKINTTGQGAFSGLLGDGTSVNLSLRLSPAGQSVLWAQPYPNKQSFIGGIVSLTHLGQPVSSNPKLTDTLWWSKAADDNSPSYPDGFPAMPITLGTSRWTSPATAGALGASLGWRDNRMTSVTIDGAGLSNEPPQSTDPALPTEFTLDDAFNLSTSKSGNDDDDRRSEPDDDDSSNTLRDLWKGKVVKTDGTFTGVLKIPSGFSRNIPSGEADVSGVLVQDDPWGTVTGCGLIKVPVSGANGRFRTAAIILEQ